MKKISINILLIVCLHLSFISENIFSSDKQKKLDCFQNAKFGMFIHWGLYSMIGWDLCSWARHRLEIPLKEYQYYLNTFNPVDYDPDVWVNLAKKAGMKYIIFTTKHHDGFCLFDSKLTDYDIMHTPYKKDALKMLANSCRKKNMALGLYYSIMDWHHPDYIPRRKWEKDRPTGDANMDHYILHYMRGQLKELIDNYNPFLLWFDGAWEHTAEELHSAEIEKYLSNFRPDMLINDRLFKKLSGHGDIGTPENYVPATGLKNPDGSPRIWEACYTIGYNSWGYNQYEYEFHSTVELIRMLIEIVSKGGNLLLNVGPTPRGTIPIEFIDRLNGIGKWLNLNGEAIYGTTASCFEHLPFYGKCTVKGNILFFHIMGWPHDGMLRIPGLKTRVNKTYLLVQRDKSLNFKRVGNDILITLPEKIPDKIATTVTVELSGKPVVENRKITPNKDDMITLPIFMAEIRAGLGQRAFLDHIHRHTLLVNWRNTKDIPVWQFITKKETRYSVKLSYASGYAGSNFKVIIDDQELKGVVKKTAFPYIPKPFYVGDLLLNPGEHVLKIKILNIKNNESMRLEKVILEKP